MEHELPMAHPPVVTVCGHVCDASAQRSSVQLRPSFAQVSVGAHIPLESQLPHVVIAPSSQLAPVRAVHDVVLVPGWHH